MASLVRVKKSKTVTVSSYIITSSQFWIPSTDGSFGFSLIKPVFSSPSGSSGIWSQSMQKTELFKGHWVNLYHTHFNTLDSADWRR